MKKGFWLVPAAMFLIALVTVIYLNQRDIVPEDMVYSVDVAGLSEISEAAAVSLLDEYRAEFEACVYDEALPPPDGVLKIVRGNALVSFVLAEKYGSYTQYLAYGEASEAYDTKGAEGYNLGAYRRTLEGGWTYCVDYVAPLTYADQYVSRISESLSDTQLESLEGSPADGRYVLLSKVFAPYPAELSESQYVVHVTLMLKDGSTLSGSLDPKTKLFIGWEE